MGSVHKSFRICLRRWVHTYTDMTTSLTPTLCPVPYFLEWDHPHSFLITAPPPWPFTHHPSLLFPPPIIHHCLPPVFGSPSLYHYSPRLIQFVLPASLPFPVLTSPSSSPLFLFIPSPPPTIHLLHTAPLSFDTCVFVCQRNKWLYESDKPRSYLPTRALTSAHYSAPADHQFNTVTRGVRACVCVWLDE